MLYLVIPDVHLKPEMFDIVDSINPDLYDNIVCLGDLVDDFGKQLDAALYERTLDRILKFDEDHPNMLWCIGNHDFSYMHYGFNNSGHSKLRQPLVSSKLYQLKERAGDRMKVIHREEYCLFSHAGLTQSFVDDFIESYTFTWELLDRINASMDDSEQAYNLWRADSPIWVRPNDIPTVNDLWHGNEYLQVVGHTPVKTPLEDLGCLLLCDTFSTHRDGRPIGDKRFIIVDTITKKWHYAN